MNYFYKKLWMKKYEKNVLKKLLIWNLEGMTDLNGGKKIL